MNLGHLPYREAAIAGEHLALLNAHSLTVRPALWAEPQTAGFHTGKMCQMGGPTQPGGQPVRMIHFVAGPLDGTTLIWSTGHEPFLLARPTADGWYEMNFDVAGQPLPPNGSLTLTADDAIAQWHERAAHPDLQVGDSVIIQPVGRSGQIAVGPLSSADPESTDRQWLVKVDDDPLPWVCGDDDLRLVTRAK